LKHDQAEGRARKRQPFSLGGGAGRVWVLNLSVLAVAAALVSQLVVGREGVPDRPFTIPWWGMALAFYVAEICVVHLQFKREAYHFSLAEIPLVMGLFLASPPDLVLGQVLGALLALGVHRRQSPIKLVFNVAHYGLEASLAAIIFHDILSVASAFDPTGWALAYGATMVGVVVGTAAVVGAISLSEGKLRLDTAWASLPYATAITGTNTSIALLGVVIIWAQPSAALLLTVPTVLVFLSYRAYMDQRDKTESVEFLYESTRRAQRNLDVDSAVGELLSHAREMFRAEVAQLTMFDQSEDGTARQTQLGPGEHMATDPLRLDPLEGVWARVAAEGQALLIEAPIENERLRGHFSEKSIFKDAMVAPIFGGERVIGILTIGDRLGDVSTFDSVDLTLFETLANHASVTLENARLVDRLKDSLAQATEMNRLKDDFVAAVSHELRTPLTSIQGYVKTMLRPNVSFSDEQRQSFLEAVERQSERLRTLIEDLLVVSRLEGHQLKAVVAPVQVPQMLDRVMAELGHRKATHPIELVVDKDTPVLESDEGKIHQVVSNLVENACKYSPDGSKVEVTARREGDGVLVSVRDGIPEEARDKIFDRFFQVDQSSTRSAGGTGLGLYICRRLAEALGGRVWLEASGPEGSVFSLWVPRRAPAPGSRIAAPVEVR
jgi:signal transduction histidine kinase